ncbi:MAG TPA: magnesium chelatase subunit H [Methanothrix soehngenii]|jgi:cobaltochelatase CobN|uniref:magnesium chelatase subunit H n=1 Tax=Methanothrix soehngenii TaxID=2223 RepID=UPI0009D58269|nr:magnesium chelatase subunit H [Methanothrix soehngenii]OPX83391.1 MAG: cobaltochelatase subunit CobN [Methanosaeta sp. PtaB.Bin005]HNQ53149.1 magnesium chelatase subunit H [Methanothrix soehngenii]HOI21186.1 magnesium chelatase subunit H [Methanothrix soehngenii]
MKVVVVSPILVPSLIKASEDLKDEFGLNLDLRIYHPSQIDNEEVVVDEFTGDLKSADAVLIDLMGAGGQAIEVISCSLKDEKNVVVSLVVPMGRAFQQIMPLTRLGSFQGGWLAERMAGIKMKGRPDDEDPEALRRRMNKGRRTMEMALKMVQAGGKVLPVGPMKDAGNYIKFTRYWKYGGQENYRNLLILLLGEYLHVSLPPAKDPIERPDFGLYHPLHGYFEDLEEYLKKSGFDDRLPTIGILFYGGRYFDQCKSTVEAIVSSLRKANIIPVYSDGINNLHAMRRFFFLNGQPITDALVNLTMFRLNGGPLGGNHQLSREILKEINAPLFTPASMLKREIGDWMRSPTGLNPMETIMSVIWPELDGSIEPIPCCGVDVMQNGSRSVREVVPIPERVNRICSRIQNKIKLKNKPDREKRIGLIIYSYPPGEGHLGGASYLDVFKSIKCLLKRMAEEGFAVDVPEGKLHDLFEDLAIVNSGQWLCAEETLKNSFYFSAGAYRDYFYSLPEEMQDDVTSAWGDAPGTVMTSGEKILIPGIELGNVFLGVQPARPPLKGQDLSGASHDKTKPPHHQYIAFYRWLETVWRADAIVHVGTHGLAEFTKGKEVGMSASCFPDLLIGDMPHLYFYHVTNASEAVIAKRRLYATIISHNNPPFTSSDLYEDYVLLQNLIDEHGEAKVQNPESCSRIKERILAAAQALHFEENDIDRIHDELYEMKRSIIPKGLHVLGEGYEKEDLKRFLEFVLRYDRGDIKSINRIFAEEDGLDYDSALMDRSSYVPQLAEVDRRCTSIVECCLERSLDEAVEESALSSERRSELREALRYGIMLLESYSDNEAEIDNFICGLRGEFIEQGDGGDIIRSPEILPTGRNLTQFDPTRIPTENAFKRGEEIARNTLSEHLERNGCHPESIGTVLWGFETTKTGGETVGQILSYLGVRIERSRGTWSPKLSVVPLDVLGRPRIDCLVNICGFFRDMFPNLLELLDQAFDLVAGLDEPLELNYIRKHSMENLEHLKDKGLDPKTTRKMANGRIFGPQAGEYGTRILPLIEDSIWKTEDELAEVFIQSANHLYARDLHACKLDSLYRDNLARVKLVSQVRDSHDREIIDLDHYFEYFGGLSNAVRRTCGVRPQMLISDTTGEAIRTEDLKSSVNRGIRTRLLNPKWIDGMLEHDYHGAQQIVKRVENALGLAATTHIVDNWIWSSVAERYIFDDMTRERITENNRFVAAELVERLVEAENRGYWKATDEEKEKLRAAYLKIEGEIEDSI